MKASHLSQNAFFEKKVGEEVRRMRRVGETNEGSILAFGEPTWGEISVDLSDDVNEILYETPDVPSDLLRLTQKFKADKYWQFFFIFLHFRQALVTFVDESFDTISNIPAYQKVKQVNDSNTRKYGSTHKHKHRLDEDEIKPRHWFTHTGLTNGRRSKLHATLPSLCSHGSQYVL
jgi:hypothetical protein